MNLNYGKDAYLISKSFNPTNNAGIYIIENNINKKIYIGQTNSFSNRWFSHIKDLIKNKHNNIKLQYDFNIYGINAFNFKIIKEFKSTKEEREDLEERLICLAYENKVGLYNIIKDIAILKNKIIKILTNNNMNYIYKHKIIKFGVFDFLVYKDKNYKHIDFSKEYEFSKIIDKIYCIIFIRDYKYLSLESNIIKLCNKYKVNHYIYYMKDNEIISNSFIFKQ